MGALSEMHSRNACEHKLGFQMGQGSRALWHTLATEFAVTI